MLVFGQLSGNEFMSQYQHPVSRDGWVEWIHQDQIAFAGADGTLYAYDRRNAAVSVLLKKIGLFRLSQDRKFIVYTQGGDSVYAARLYGNNVLDMKQIYQGIIASQMAWSPDNGKLLLSGKKPIEFVKSTDGVTKEIQNLVIELK